MPATCWVWGPRAGADATLFRGEAMGSDFTSGIKELSMGVGGRLWGWGMETLPLQG